MCQCANITKNCSVDSLVILVRVYILSSSETFAQYFWNKSRCIFLCGTDLLRSHKPTGVVWQKTKCMTCRTNSVFEMCINGPLILTDAFRVFLFFYVVSH